MIVQKNNRYNGSNKDNNSDKDNVFIWIFVLIYVLIPYLLFMTDVIKLEHLSSVELMYLSLSCRKTSHTDILAGHVLRQKSR